MWLKRRKQKVLFTELAKLCFEGLLYILPSPLTYHLKTQLDKFNIDQLARYQPSTLKPRAPFLSAGFW